MSHPLLYHHDIKASPQSKSTYLTLGRIMTAYEEKIAGLLRLQDTQLNSKGIKQVVISC